MLFQGLLALVIMVVFVQPIITYVLDPKHLRKFPSPQYAGLSSIWRIIQNLKKRHYLAIDDVHRRLGTHVRIAPNHISISNPQAVQDIYGHGANFMKDAWYDGGAGEYRHMADTRIKAEHQAKRKKLAHLFAQKTIANLEPVVCGCTGVLVNQIDNHIASNKPINMRRYLNYYTIDLFAELLYGYSLECLERGDDIIDAETKNGKVYKVAFIKSLHEATIKNTVLGMEAPLLPLTKKLFSWHPYMKSGADYDNIVHHNTVKRMRATNNTEDIFSKLLQNSKGEDLNLPFGEVFAECNVMMNAGTDTTTAALTNSIYLIYKHPDVLQKLRKELDGATGEEEVPSYDKLANLPYLRACIEEALRVRPASSMGLPRVVPKGGRWIAGQFIDENVTVSVPTYTLLRNADAFDDAASYIPERWMEGDKDRMNRAHFPFSTGPRACIGRNIAYFEQVLVIGTLVRLFDFDFQSEDFQLETLERFNSNPGEMFLTARRRCV
ncbi:cytochrome P450-21 [Coleophoma crateriformis]|uniref:Cytochrome P450-21 n=1 Tax=Coleophoma crateriformis TaxID=565419 RepID=A0A3D8SZH7_9HELO|nr:cytochrome P450-21 [Coleophoma crateriformis]